MLITLGGRGGDGRRQGAVDRAGLAGRQKQDDVGDRDKSGVGQTRFYKRLIEKADDRYDAWLKETKERADGKKSR